MPNIFDRSAISLQKHRAIFKFDPIVTTSFNVGDLVPILCEPVYPGDTWVFDMDNVTRTTTLVVPPMDTLFQDFCVFFVPDRIIWQHFKEFMGELSNNEIWVKSSTYNKPQLNFGSYPDIGTVADHLYKIPVKGQNASPTAGVVFPLDALPARAYAKIYNDWFRNQNTQQGADFYDDDTNRGYDSTSAVLGGKLLQVNKFRDYFTSCLPGTQRSDAAVSIPGQSLSANVVANNSFLHDMGGPIRMSPASSMAVGAYANLQIYNSLGNPNVQGLISVTGSSGSNITRSNLVTSTGDVLIDVNALRFSIQLQKWYERSARGGSRYIEYCLSAFGVRSPDARQQRSEYICGKRVPLQIYSAPQTSASESGSTPQGNLAAYSVTAGGSNKGDGRCVWSSTEHGWLLAMTAVRYHHMYAQGIPRKFQCFSRWDMYDPVFCHIGEQPVWQSEIFAVGTNGDPTMVNRPVFGYQEAWAWLRYFPNTVSGHVRPMLNPTAQYGSPQFAEWTYTDLYATAPTLDALWSKEDKTNINRSLAVDDTVADQILCQIAFNGTVTRVMSQFSDPGLVDHF